MFRLLLARQPTLFTFLSGAFVAISASALSAVIFPPDRPNNAVVLYVVALLTLLAAIGWFWLGERVASLRAIVERNAAGFGGDAQESFNKAVALVAQDEAIQTYILVLVTIVLSLVWPVVDLYSPVASPSSPPGMSKIICSCPSPANPPQKRATQKRAIPTVPRQRPTAPAAPKGVPGQG